jgi:hypothetical protein
MTVPEGFCFFQRLTKVAANRLDAEADRGLESMCSSVGMSKILRKEVDRQDAYSNNFLPFV